MTGLAAIRTSLEQCYDAIEALAGRMDAVQWHARSLCPDWDMRDVIVHLGMMERVMTGWLPESAGDPPPLDRIGPYHEEMAALDDTAFAGRIGEIFARRRADLAGLTEADLARPSWSAVCVSTSGPGKPVSTATSSSSPAKSSTCCCISPSTRVRS